MKSATDNLLTAAAAGYYQAKFIDRVLTEALTLKF